MEATIYTVPDNLEAYFQVSIGIAHEYIVGHSTRYSGGNFAGDRGFIMHQKEAYQTTGTKSDFLSGTFQTVAFTKFDLLYSYIRNNNDPNIDYNSNIAINTTS